MRRGPDRCFHIFRHPCKIALFDSHFKNQIKRSGLRSPDTLESRTISRKSPGSLRIPGSALLALLRPVPSTLAPSLQRSRSVPRPVVLDVQLSHSSGGVVDRAGDFPAIGRCGHRQISTVTRFQAHPCGLLHWSRGPRSRAAGGSLLTGAILKARSADGVSGSLLGRSVVTPKLFVAGLSFVSSLALLHKLQVISKFPIFAEHDCLQSMPSEAPKTID